MTIIRRAGVVLGVALLVVATWAIVRQPEPRGWVEIQCSHMATTISVTVRDDERAALAGTIVSDTFAEVDQMMSEWKPGSPLTAVNEQAGVAPVGVPKALRDVVARGVRLGEATDGAFDVTWAALWGVWDFKATDPIVPDGAEIQRRAALVDASLIEIDDEAGTIFLPKEGMKIGLGGIAKGYAIDLAVARLHDAGFDDFLLVAGGQVYGAGDKSGTPWRVGVRDPRGAPDDLIASIELENASASTSGDYERFFEIDGTRYHHILDPRTGWPSRGAQSVTLVASEATLADALSTAVMILGPTRGRTVIDEFGVWALVVDASGTPVEMGAPGPPMQRLWLSDESGG